MKGLLSTLLLLTAHASVGQILVNGKDLNDLDSGTHIQVQAQELNSKLTVTVDYGQPKEFDGRRIENAMVQDGTTKKKFKSPVDALNFFLNNGWELVDFSISSNEAVSLYIYLLKRKGG